MRNRTIFLLMVIVGAFFLVGCGAGEGVSGPINETVKAIEALNNPTERGLAWVACAILISGCLRAICNK